MNKLRRIPDFLRSWLGVLELTPAQRAKLEELEQDYADWTRQKLTAPPAPETENEIRSRSPGAK